jgi:anaerobic selenocysteine-containing dehydrogenase
MRAQGLKLSRRAFLTAATGALGGLLLSRFWPAPGNTEPAPLAPERFVPTTCWIGKQDCGMLARVINGRVVKFEGHPAHPRNLGRLCPKGMAQIIALYDPNRVKTPLIRTNEKGVPGQFRAASWEEVLTLVAEKIKEVRAKDPRLLFWQKGRSKAPAFYDEAFVKASGATKLHPAPSAPTPATARVSIRLASPGCSIPTSSTAGICSPGAGISPKLEEISSARSPGRANSSKPRRRMGSKSS